MGLLSKAKGAKEQDASQEKDTKDVQQQQASLSSATAQPAFVQTQSTDEIKSASQSSSGFQQSKPVQTAPATATATQSASQQQPTVTGQPTQLAQKQSGQSTQVTKTAQIDQVPNSVQTDKQNQKTEQTQETQKIESNSQMSARDAARQPSQETELTDDQKLTIKQDLLRLAKGQDIVTDADEIYNLISQSQKGISLADLHKNTNIAKKRIKFLTDAFYKYKAASIHYSLNVLASPVVRVDKTFQIRDAQYATLPEDKKIVEEYKITTDNVTAYISIWNLPSESVPIYEVVPHKLQTGTLVMIQHVIDILAEKIPVTTVDITNPHKVAESKEKFFGIAIETLKEAFPQAQEDLINFLAGIVVHKSYGLGELETVMGDDWLEEIAINGSGEPVSMYHKRYGWLKSTIYLSGDGQIYDLASQISRKVGKQINALNPIMDAHLQTGDRVASTLYPVSTEGDTMTIRRFSRNPWTVTHMIDPKVHTMSNDILAFMWAIVQYELNFMVVGGTASGKTSVLNILSSLTPPTNRIISIEDTREITLPEALHWNWVPMVSKSANTEGQGEVTMLDLMVASLRMRPDRIIVGEIRRKQQAEALFEAMHTGHSVCATMHADTAEQIKRRLTQPPIDIPENEIQALQLVLVQYRDRRKGVRRTLEVAELLPATKGEKINLNYLFRWRPRSDEFVQENESIRVLEDLNLHTGMTQTDFDNDLHQKKLILEWLSQNSIKDVDTIGKIMRVYYKYPQLLLDVVQDKGNLQNLFSI